MSFRIWANVGVKVKFPHGYKLLMCQGVMVVCRAVLIHGQASRLAVRRALLSRERRGGCAKGPSGVMGNPGESWASGWPNAQTLLSSIAANVLSPLTPCSVMTLLPQWQQHPPWCYITVALFPVAGAGSSLLSCTSDRVQLRSCAQTLGHVNWCACWHCGASKL